MDVNTLKGKVLTLFENKHETAWIDFPDHDLNGSQRFAKEERAMNIRKTETAALYQ